MHVVGFEGNSLPHAFIHLPKGTVRPTDDAKLHGVIWAHSICAAGGNIQLVTEDSGGTVVRTADSLWGWSDQGFPGYGRMVTRGIRGTGLDTFRRW